MSAGIPITGTTNAPVGIGTFGANGSYTPTGTAGHDMPWGPNGEVYNSDGSLYGNIQNIPSSVDAPAPDPYAAWGGTAAYNSLVNGYDSQHNNIYSTATDAANSGARGYENSILDFLDQLTSGQKAIDERGVQNELGKKQGYDSIVDMVGRGLKSGGTLLSNKNALSSSAAEAIARAYADIGRQENNKVNNGYELEDRNIGMAQDDFNTQRAGGLRKLNSSKQDSIDSITAAARNGFFGLDAAMLGDNLGGRYDANADTNNVRNSTAGIFNQYDGQLAGANNIGPSSTDARRATALGLANKGVSADNPFDFTSQVPAQFQNSGPFANEFPLFSVNTKKQTA